MVNTMSHCIAIATSVCIRAILEPRNAFATGCYSETLTFQKKSFS